MKKTFYIRSGTDFRILRWSYARCWKNDVC